MDIKELFSPLLRWLWLILIATIIAAGSSYYVSLDEPLYFQSQGTLMIGRTIDNPNPTSVQFNLEEQLAVSYANIANRVPLREATKAALGLDWLPEYSVNAVPNTQLIEIEVVDTDPSRAQLVALEIANQLILRSPTSETQEDIDRQAFINQQLDTLQNQITDAQADIEDLTFLLGELNSAREIADTEKEISSLQTKLSSLQSNYGNLIAQTDKGAINTLTIIEIPNLPTQPIGSQKILTIGLSAAVGFTLAAAAAYLLEYLDKSVRSVEEVKKITQAPILGYIPKIPRKSNELLFVSEKPRSPISDSFRNLRTNIELFGSDYKVIVCTSATISDGKSTVAMNLAQINTQADKKVILMDGDLRKSPINKKLNLHQDKGLSKILQGQSNLSEGSITLDNGTLVIPSGNPPPNPTELLASEMMTQTMSSLRKVADLIVIDAPPFFVTDTAILTLESRWSFIGCSARQNKAGYT